MQALQVGFGRVGSTRIHTDGPGIEAHVAEGGVLRAPIEVVLSGERIVAGGGLGFAEFDKLFGMRIWEGLKQGGMNQGKNGGVRTNSESECHHGDKGKARIAHEHSRGVTDILHRILQPIHVAHAPTLLLA